MSVILLAIKPEYVEKILNRTKKYEFRKRIAKIPVKTILIYSTYPKMEIVGEVKVIQVLSYSPTHLWEETKHEAGISRAKYREYFKGCKIAYAYKLGDVTIFNKPRKLSDYNVIFPPQSFIYIDKNYIE